ncbi:MAG: site-2 protease family protein [Christensenellaceae bacterium]|nr:site-2 protease family protein [Christensenellaceae bacterium]
MENLLTATLGGTFQTIGYIVLALLALLFMVVIHEFGHYLAGKILGFKIMEFAIGFGPAIFKHKSKKTGEVFSIRPFPIGGFCQFEDEDASSNSPTAFNNQKPWKRLIVLFAGAFFNFLAALIIITLFFTFYGQMTPTILYIGADSPNYGIVLEGDALLSMDGRQLNILMAEDVNNAFARLGDSAEITVLRNGKILKLTATKGECISWIRDEDGNIVQALNEDGSVKTYYGFGFNSAVMPQKLGFFRAFGRAFSFSFFMVYKILAIMGQLFTGQIGLENAGGPIATISVMTNAAASGLATFSFVVCLISANLAVMNLLPLPALDGSRMVFCLIEWIFKKPIKKKVEGLIHATGFMLLIGFVIFADLFRLITVGI